MMQAADVNSDGSIDYAEFVTAAMDMEKLLSEQNLEAAFKMFDADGNGSITAAAL